MWVSMPQCIPVPGYHALQEQNTVTGTWHLELVLGHTVIWHKIFRDDLSNQHNVLINPCPLFNHGSWWQSGRVLDYQSEDQQFNFPPSAYWGSTLE